MRLVIIESPFAGDEEEHIDYARDAMNHSFECGEYPFASHLLYTQIFDDSDPLQRKLGIKAGLAWGAKADATIVYKDLGITAGMKKGILRALKEKRPVEYRKIYK